MGKTMRHAFTRWTYEDQGDRKVLVTDPETGRTGLFEVLDDATARWVEGEITAADIHLICWVGGPRSGGRIPGMQGTPAQASSS